MDIGFIGVGNMGGAILRGLVASRKLENSYYISGRDYKKTADIAKELMVNALDSADKVVRNTEIFFLGVKPGKFEEVLPDVKKKYVSSKICVSMAAGITMEYIENYIGKDAKIVRIMPNTPVLVGEGMISVSRNKNVTAVDMEKIVSMLSLLGKVEEVEEDSIHAVIGVSGSSPAYTYMYIDALVKNAVENGIDSKAARVFAAQAVLGAAKMVLESDTNLDVLVNNVCSPGGTTIEAVEFLRDASFEKIVGNAAQAAIDKSKKMNG